MRIHSFSFTDLETDWHLDAAEFDSLNLLVGISGVGKTRIIESLRTVTAVAIDRPVPLPLAAWSLRFEHDDVDYEWSASIERSNTQRGGRAFTKERLLRTGEPLVERTGNELIFARERQPKLDLTTSAIDLLAPEDAIEPVRRAFELMLFSLFSGEHHQEMHRPFDVPERWMAVEEIVKEKRDLLADEPRLERPAGSDREVSTRSVFVFDLYLMQEVYPDQFEAIAARFREVFPSVEAMRVKRDAESHRERFSVELRESSGTWVPQAMISAGMLRTLVYLYEFETAPAKSVVLIDEFEGSLGVNCLPTVTRALTERDDCQFIITSHHPYVINNIPIARWKLVERDGNVVRLRSSATIPALQRASHHEAFLRLINLDAYAESIR